MCILLQFLKTIITEHWERHIPGWRKMIQGGGVGEIDLSAQHPFSLPRFFPKLSKHHFISSRVLQPGTIISSNILNAAK